MYERMLDKLTEPDYESMTAWCGAASALFVQMNDALQREFGTQTHIRFPYGKKYGWGVDHRLKSKHIADVFPENGAFNVMLRLSDEQFFSVYDGLLPETRTLIDQRYPCGDGGWIHLRVTQQEQLRDALKLLRAKIQGKAK